MVSKHRLIRPAGHADACLEVVNSISGQLQARAQAVLNGRNYQVRVSTDGGKTWTVMGTFNSPRRMLVQPVIAGTTYMVEAFLRAAAPIKSPWSDPLSRMAT